MAIQWFPGHMHKARKEMAAVLPRVDVILEVLDARIPYSSENPMLAELRGNKPCLRVLTKADLADPQLTDDWLIALRCSASDKTSADGSSRTVPDTPKHSNDAIAIRTDQPDSISQILPRLSILVPRQANRVKPRVVLVMGIPNVGKSTLINHLIGRNIAKTGNEPAITKRQQPVAFGEGWVLRDTPGVLWPKVENPASGFRLAASGAIRDTAMDSGEVAAALLDHLRIVYPDFLRTRFSDELPLNESVETLEAIGRQRGCLGGGGLVDFDKAGRLLLQEFRSGKLGRITLETPAMRDKESIAVDEARVALTAKREARRTAGKKRRQQQKRK
ncbi:MAG: ribosome biogenesis GTPase YlqF [Granulosicoccus sp.]